MFECLGSGTREGRPLRAGSLPWAIGIIDSVAPKIEAVFSSQKRRTGHIRLQVRRWKADHLKALTYPPKVPKGFPENIV